MHSKIKDLSLVVIIVSSILIITFTRILIFSYKYVLYYVPELELFIRLSPSYSGSLDECLFFSKERDKLPTRNTRYLPQGVDYIQLPSSLSKGRAFVPTVYIKMDSVLTLYTAEIPHSVSIPMEELFDHHMHHHSPSVRQLLFDSPGFMVFNSLTGSEHSRALIPFDERLSFLEIERQNY